MRVRPASVDDAAEIARVRVDTWRKTYQHLLPSQYLDSLDYGSMTAHWKNILNANGRQGFTLVVEEDGKIIGFALGGDERLLDLQYQAEIYALYVLPTFQRLGAGKTLIGAMVRHFLAEGKKSMLVWVLKGNPSKEFYEKMGGVFIREQDVQIGGESYREAAYGWDDLSMLAEL